MPAPTGRWKCAAVVEVGKALLDIALKPETGSRPPDVLIPYARRTAREVVHACTEDTWLRTMMLYQHGGYCVAPSEESFIHHSVLAYHYLSTGGFYPIGGGQVMSDRLAAALEKAGGKILLGTMVEKIVVENGRAVGVNLRNKHIGARTVRAGTVLSNADLKRTYSDLLDESILPATSRKRVSNYVMSFGSCVLCLGVKRNLIQHGMSRSNYWVHTSASTEYIYDLARRGEFDQMPGFYLTSPHLKDPDHTKSAPAGISNVQVMTIVPSEPEAWGVTAAQVADGSYRKEPAYLATKALLAKRLLASVDRVLPNFSADVVFSELMTPMTHTRYTLSSGGTGLGIAGLPKQIFLPPPSCRTEIDGLLLCGTNTRFGTGVMSAMAAGWRAAELASRAAP